MKNAFKGYKNEQNNKRRSYFLGTLDEIEALLLYYLA